jgi:RNA polymerase sigma-70 factor (ECF subfamily)
MRDGDRAVLVADTVEQHRDRLVGFFVRRTGDRPLSEDLAHETLARFAGMVDRFDQDRPVWPYLRTVAANLLTDAKRAQSRLVVMDVEDVVGAGPGCDQLEDEVVLRSVLGAALEGLSRRQRVAVELRFERGWDVADAAAFLGLSPNAFRQLLFRARRNLREALERSGVVPGLVVPLVVSWRVWWRSAGARVREVVRGPSSSVALTAEGFASVVMATTMAVVVAVGGATSGVVSGAALAGSVVGVVPTGQDMVPTVAPMPELDAGSVVGPGGAVTASTGDVAEPSVAPRPDAGRTTVIEAPEAVPDSDGRVTVDENEEYFEVSDDVEVRTGVESVTSEGTIVAVSCNSALGQILCRDGAR